MEAAALAVLDRRAADLEPLASSRALGEAGGGIVVVPELARLKACISLPRELLRKGTFRLFRDPARKQSGRDCIRTAGNLLSSASRRYG